jgi:hypothetical protein
MGALVLVVPAICVESFVAIIILVHMAITVAVVYQVGPMHGITVDVEVKEQYL